MKVLCILLAVTVAFFATVAISVAQEECTVDQFTCNLTGDCIPADYVCDGEADCYDSSDEHDCNCDGQFVCNSTGICIPEDYICDWYDDCEDGSDEVDCACDGFLCTDGNDCVPESYRCDGYEDCDDGSDEAGTCPSTTTTTPGPCFACTDGSECVPGDYRCDGWSDCNDNSDEVDCPCKDGEVKCKNGQCIKEEYWCDADGIYDCNDESDQDADVCAGNGTQVISQRKPHRVGLPKLSLLARQGKIIKFQYQKKLVALAKKHLKLH